MRPWSAFILVLLVVLVPSGADAAEDDGEAVRGTLVADGEPVEGVVVVVSDASGAEVASATTNAEGEFEVPLPAPDEYLVRLDEATLPGGLELRDADNNPLTVTIRPGAERTVLFPLGEGIESGQSLPQRFPQAVVNGIKFGLIVAMTAVGLSLIFGTTGLINFAHGELVTIGAIVALYLNTPGGLQMPLLAAAAIALVVGALLGIGLEVGLWRSLRRRRAGAIQLLIITLGLSLVLRHVILIAFGPRARPYQDYAVQQPFSIGPVSLTARDVLVVGLSVVVLVAVGLLLTRTRAGKAMRAVADNIDLAESSGIDVRRVFRSVWMLGGALAALGGVLFGVVEAVTWDMGFRLLLPMFAAVIVGGIGTAFGTIVGSVLIGLVIEISTLFFSTELKFLWALVLLILVLMFRPQGILGSRERIG